MNLISPDSLFEICTYMYLKHARESSTIQAKHQSSTMKSTVTQDFIFYKRSVYPFPVAQILKPYRAKFQFVLCVCV